MVMKDDCTKYACTRTGGGEVVFGLREDVYPRGYELPEVLGMLDAPFRIAAGSAREGVNGDTIHASVVWRE